MDLPPPDVLATEVPADTLDSTARSIVTTAKRAGYQVRVTRALGPRIPRQASQPVERVGSLTIVGTMAGWIFTASHTIRDGWDVTIHRPGWPGEVANIAILRRMLTAQTPATIKV